MAAEYSVEIAELIRKYLVEDDWKFNFDEERGLFTFGLNLKCKFGKARYEVKVGETDYMVRAYVKQDAEESVRQNVCEFITRANFGLINGNFEMDFDDGELRYKSWCNCDNMMPSSAIIKNSIIIPALMLERFGDGLAAVIFGIKDPKQAIDDIHAGDN